MARKELRKIATDDGADFNHASCFAECCINILQMGCRYPKGVEKRIERLLKDRGGVCADIIMRMKAPRGGMKKTRKLGPAPPGYKVEKDKDGFPYFVYIEKSQHVNNRTQHRNNKKRWRSRSPDRYDRNRPVYYEDRNPHVYNQYRPHDTQYQYGQQRQYKRPRNSRRPHPNQMGRMESQRGRTFSRPTEIPRKSQGKTTGP